MSTHNKPFSISTQKNHPKLSQIRSYEIFSKGLKNKFETAVINELSVFEPLKLYCSMHITDVIKSKAASPLCPREMVIKLDNGNKEDRDETY